MKVSVNMSEEENAEFLRWAAMEGIKTVPGWLMAVARRRAALLREHAKPGAAIRVTEVMVPLPEGMRIVED
jgi:hypothetical protein